jgi:hypothetical protein
MSVNLSSQAAFPAELTATMDSTWKTIGSLTYVPVQIIFDNQSTVSVAISVDGGTTTWRTFPAGEALVLDMRGNKGLADNFAMQVGTVFSGNGASGTFSISYLYARN